MALLLALALFTQDPTLEDLFRALRSDSILEREKAWAEIVKRGEPVLKSLREEQGKTKDNEARARIESAIVRIEREKRRKEFKGGIVVCGLAARLAVEQDKTSGEAVFRVEIMNVDTKPRELVLIEEWDYSTPLRPEKSGVQTKILAAQARVLIADDPARTYPDGTILLGSTMFRCHAEPSRKQETLEPGESRTFSFRLKLDRGGYRASVTYYAESKKLLSGASGDLSTNSLQFGLE